MIRILGIVGGHDAPWALAAAIGHLGRCSATLVGPTVVLTSAHCLDATLDHVTFGGSEVAVTSCAHHPSYQPGQVAHDIGYCRLATSVAGALPVDTAHRHAAGDAASLAGFGATGATTHEKPALRMVSTSIVDADGDRFDVGTATATACHGDSGGPVLLERDGAFLVTGIIQGARGVICGSAARAVPLETQLDWLKAVLAVDANRGTARSALACALALVVAVAGVLALRRRRGRG